MLLVLGQPAETELMLVPAGKFVAEYARLSPSSSDALMVNASTTSSSIDFEPIEPSVKSTL